MSFMNVDLPAPFGPSRPVMPGGTLTVTSFRPITWPYHLETCSAVTIGAAFGGVTGSGAALATGVATGTLMSPPPLHERGARAPRRTGRSDRGRPAATPA